MVNYCNSVKIGGIIMKRPVNLRLDENIITILNDLANKFHSTKTEIIEKAIILFSKQNNITKNNLLQFAGKLKSHEADEILKNIKENKNSKDLNESL